MMIPPLISPDKLQEQIYEIDVNENTDTPKGEDLMVDLIKPSEQFKAAMEHSSKVCLLF